MDLDAALAYAQDRRKGVLVTLKKNGRPQLSNISFHVSGDGEVRVSITATRAKYHNVKRDARVSLYVTSEDFWSYVVLEGDASLTPPAAAPDDATVEALVDLYRGLLGEHPDWDDYRVAMVRDQRVVLSFRPQHAYGMT